MSNLLEIYDAMLQADQEQVSETIEKNAEEQLTQDRLEVLNKYATTADNMLAEEYGNDYSEDDVTELATYLIEKDAALEEKQEKIAEQHQLGIIMAKAFKAELAATEEIKE